MVVLANGGPNGARAGKYNFCCPGPKLEGCEGNQRNVRSFGLKPMVSNHNLCHQTLSAVSVRAKRGASNTTSAVKSRGTRDERAGASPPQRRPAYTVGYLQCLSLILYKIIFLNVTLGAVPRRLRPCEAGLEKRKNTSYFAALHFSMNNSVYL